MPLLTVGHGPATGRRLGTRSTGRGAIWWSTSAASPAAGATPTSGARRWRAWLPGARRRLPLGRAARRPAAACPLAQPVADGWWTVAQFAAYAAHTRTPEFAAALDEVLTDAAGRTVAVMCSESVWWRCHRRLIADVAVLGAAWPVAHLMPDGRLTPHRPADGAVVGADGLVRWPGPADTV